MRRLICALAAACALLAFSPAHAQSQAGIAGEWVFEAQLDENGAACAISGRAIITATRRRGVYAVRTIGGEDCPGITSWRTEQSCVARQERNMLAIECTLTAADPPNYVRDNFNLSIVSRDLMRGVLISARTGAAVWRRAAAPLVS